MSDINTFFIFTTGCKANQWDSHVIATRLKKGGFAPGTIQNADFIIVNACSLTERAETDVRRFIQRSRQLNRGAKVLLVGCHAQAYPGRDFGADLVLGQVEKFEIDRFLAGKGCFVSGKRDFLMEESPIDGIQKDRTRFFFKIQDGCNKFCSYCIVPYARGAARSRGIGSIAEAMQALAEKGIKEVVLTGIDVAAYRDPASGKGLKDLLVLFDEWKTPPRIRLSSVDPEYIDESFIAVMAGSMKLAKSIHLPVQSGSDTILKRMGRRHGSAFVKEVVDRLVRGVGNIGIGMDIMVGFPGEDDASFNDTYEFVRAIDIYYLHVFHYSEREGTRACAMDGKVPESVKKSRVRLLKALDAEKRDAFHRRYLGEKVRIIPEGKVRRDGLMKGFTDNYMPVYVPYKKTLENNLVEVTITDMQDGKLIGG